MNLEKKYFNKYVLILGFGKTGKSIGRFLRKQKAKIYIWDDNAKLKFSKYKYVKIYKSSESLFAKFSYIFVRKEEKISLLCRLRK